MIRYLFYLLVVIFLAVLQTTILPYLPAASRFYDFFIPFIVYLSLYKPLPDGLGVLAVSGLAMDMLSGAPIGIYLTTYLWMYIACRQAPRWVTIRTQLLFPLLVVVGVLFQNLVFAAAILGSTDPRFFDAQTLRIILMQHFWALVTAPFLWMIFQYLFARLGRLAGPADRTGA